jgi:hypothetical protein
MPILTSLGAMSTGEAPTGGGGSNLIVNVNAASAVFTQNSFSTVTFASAALGTQPYTITFNPALPATINVTTNTIGGAVYYIISGTPTDVLSATPYDYTIRDSAGGFFTNRLSVTVLVEPAPPPLTVTAVQANWVYTAGEVVPVTYPVLVTGGTAPYTYSIAPSLASNPSFTVATDFTFSASTGSWEHKTYSSTQPALSATVYTITVKDSTGKTASTNVQLQLLQPNVKTSYTIYLSLPANTSTAHLVFTNKGDTTKINRISLSYLISPTSTSAYNTYQDVQYTSDWYPQFSAPLTARTVVITATSSTPFTWDVGAGTVASDTMPSGSGTSTTKSMSPTVNGFSLISGTSTTRSYKVSMKAGDSITYYYGGPGPFGPGSAICNAISNDVGVSIISSYKINDTSHQATVSVNKDGNIYIRMTYKQNTGVTVTYGDGTVEGTFITTSLV